MLTQDQAVEILKLLKTLPSEKVKEAADYIRFLRERYGKSNAVDENDAWSDDDLHDIVAASLDYSGQSPKKSRAR